MCTAGSPVDGNLGRFYLLAIVSNAASSIGLENLSTGFQFFSLDTHECSVIWLQYA